jgi:hypothetical protein
VSINGRIFFRYIEKGYFLASRFSIDTLYLFFLLFFAFSSAILGDSTAEALLLAHFDSSLIPVLFFVNAVFLFFSSAMLMSFIDRMDRGLFFIRFCIAHSIVLIGIRCAVIADLTLFYIPLFSYAYVSKIILFLLFWTLANDLIDSRRAGKEFPIISAGGTFGAILVSFSIPWILTRFPARNLIVFWALLQLCSIGLLFPLRKKFSVQLRSVSDKEKKQRRSLKSIIGDMQLVRREPLLASMSTTYFLIFFILLNQQFLFYDQLKIQFNDADSIASFLGFFNGISMSSTFILQIVVAGAVLKRLGSARSMILMPLVLCLAFGTLFLMCTGILQPFGIESSKYSALVFWCIVGGVGTRIAFFDSFFSPNFQVFFSSLPKHIRGRGKLSIEGVVKPLAMVLTSFWLLALIRFLPFVVTVALLFCISIWIFFLSLRIRHTYLMTLTRYLTGFKSQDLLHSTHFETLSGQKQFIEVLQQYICTEEFQIKKYIIDILAYLDTDEAVRVLIDLLTSPDEKVRASVASALGHVKGNDVLEPLRCCLDDADNRVVANAISSLRSFATTAIIERIKPFCTSGNNRIRANAIIALWGKPSAPSPSDLREAIRSMLFSDSQAECVSALYAIGEIHDEKMIGDIETLYKRNEERIRRDTYLFNSILHAAQKMPHERAVAFILTLCETDSRKRRKEITTALTRIVHNGYPVDTLAQSLVESNYIVRDIIINALYTAGCTIENDVAGSVIQVAKEEFEQIMRDRTMIAALDAQCVPEPIELCMHAITEESIFIRTGILIRSAALLDPSGQIRMVAHRLRHPDRHIQGRALEVLDNTGMQKVNQWCIQVLDQGSGRGESKRAELKEKTPSTQIVKQYTRSASNWIRMCAGYALFELRHEEQ